MSISQNFPAIRPTLNLNFARSKTLDPRITFTRSSTATYVGNDGLVKTAGVDQARFDYDPATGESLGLLIEEQRSNTLPYSEDFSQSDWTTFGTASKSFNVATAPDGNFTADSITIPISSGVLESIAVSASTTYTFSSYIRGTPGSTVRILLNFNSSGLTSKTVTVSNIWKRFDVTATSNASDLNVSVQYDQGNGNTFYVWGAQLEQGSFPTSYIPTSGSTATRSADIAKITGTNFSSWYNPNKSTLYGEGRSITGGTDTQTSVYALVSIDDNTNNNRFILRRNADLYQNAGNYSGFTFRYRRSSINLDLDAFPPVTSSTGNLPLWTDSNIHKMAFAINNDSNVPHDIAGYGDGVSVDFANTGDGYTGSEILTPYTAATQMQIGFGASSTYWNGHIGKISYYPERLTNTQLQNLTK